MPTRLETLLVGTKVAGTPSIAAPDASYAADISQGQRIRRTSAACGSRLRFGFT